MVKVHLEFSEALDGMDRRNPPVCGKGRVYIVHVVDIHIVDIHVVGKLSKE